MTEYVDPFDLKSLSDEELAALGKEVGVSIEPSSEPRQPLTDELKKKAGLVPASSLVEDPAELDQGDFTPDGRYKNFEIVAQEDWPSEPRHAHIKRRFYVRSQTGVLGLVPWEGSQIVWPWEAAWHQDLHREQVKTFFKDDKDDKKK